jgi:hypothetical protein
MPTSGIFIYKDWLWVAMAITKERYQQYWKKQLLQDRLTGVTITLSIILNKENVSQRFGFFYFSVYFLPSTTERVGLIDCWCFSATFNNISAISWWPVLVGEETEHPERTSDHGQATGKLYHLRLRERA